ncbi:MAG: hypothetical protein H7287_06840 [Thermoleophilia bacterium]|nr:hypothetical protein [Thermoleophilia bacterium]
MSKRQPPRRTSGSRSANRNHRPKSTGPSKPLLAAKLVVAVADEIDRGEPLRAEIAASLLAADAYPHHWADPESIRPATAILSLLAPLRDPPLLSEGFALAVALKSLDPEDDDVVAAADETTKKLRFLGGRGPSWSGNEIGEPDYVGAWRVRDLWGDQETVYLGFRYGDDVPVHTIAFVIDRVDGGGELVDAFVAGTERELRDAWEQEQAENPDADLMTFEELSLDAAGVLLLDGLEGVDETYGEQISEDGLDTLGLLESRARLIFPHVDAEGWDERTESPYTSELDDLETWQEVAARFTTSPEFAAATDTSQLAADRIAKYAFDRGLGGVARISPNVAAALLLDALPGIELTGDQVVELASTGPATVRAWTTFASRMLELPERALEVSLRVLGEAEEDFAELLANPPLPSLGERLVDLMEADGVDLLDDDAAQSWITEFEALDQHARELRTGPVSLDPTDPRGE